jgi:hypothetical protein
MNELESSNTLKEISPRKTIQDFESILSTHPECFHGDTTNCPLKHSFAPGVYVREIFIPKDTIVVGKIHKHEHPNFLMSGKVEVFTEGEGLRILEAPLSMISKAGTKRVVRAIEDTVWITVHATEETDLGKIEEYVIAKSYDELPAPIAKELLENKEESICLG